MFFPPQADDTAGSAPPAMAEKFRDSASIGPPKRFYAGEAAQEKEKSFWRRSFLPPPQDIGVAVAPSTRTLPEHVNPGPSPSANKYVWPPQQQSMVGWQARPDAPEHRWSVATSFDEDIEAHDQDVPILGTPKGRFSGRSFSSAANVQMPAPLRLSKTKARPETPPSARLPLTPIYDNGTFETTTRPVVEDPFTDQQSAALQKLWQAQAFNFSRRQPSMIRTSQEQPPGPFTTQMRHQNPAGRFPVKASVRARKQSVVSNQSVSVYTDIEEDDTPDQEEDKQLEKVPTMSTAMERQPLRSLQWPQVPRPAAVAKQSQKVHSPRAGISIRQISPSPEALQAQAASTTRDEMVRGGRSFVKTNTSSISSQLTQSSASPIFPTPPSHKRTNVPVHISRQISNAYRSASRPTTATTPTRNSRHPNSNSISYPHVPLPGQIYQDIQRLRTGRPLAQKLQAQGYVPRPLDRSSSRAKVTPMTSRSGDLYLTVGDMEH